MGLVNITDLVDGTTADAGDLNSRVGRLVSELNGNLDGANIKDAAITTPKIATGAVTTDKLNLSTLAYAHMSPPDPNGFVLAGDGNWKDVGYTKVWRINNIDQPSSGVMLIKNAGFYNFTWSLYCKDVSTTYRGRFMLSSSSNFNNSRTVAESPNFYLEMYTRDCRSAMFYVPANTYVKMQVLNTGQTRIGSYDTNSLESDTAFTITQVAAGL